MNEHGAPPIEQTAQEFYEWYARAQGTTVEKLREHGRVPYYVSGCADYPYPHWEMGRVTDDKLDRENEIAPP